MDGRRCLLLTAGFLGGLSGCTGLGNRQSTGLPTASASPIAQGQTVQTSSPSASLPLTPHSGKLQPSTHVTMGSLAEQMADDPNRPASEREQYRAKARQSYQKAVEADAKYAPAYLALAASYAATNECEQALAHFAKATQTAPNDATVWAAQGNYFARMKEWDHAIESLSRAIQLEPGNKDHLKKLGFALARAGRVEEGYAVLAKCMSEPEARYNVARMLQHLEQPMACRWYLQMALQADPNYQPAREALAALTGAESPVRPVAYNETAPVAQDARAVQTAAYAETATAPAQTATIAQQPIQVVNGSSAAPTAAASTPPVIVNGAGNSPATPAQPVIVSNRPTTAPATATPPAPSTDAGATSPGDLPRLPPVILGSRETPAAPIKVGVDAID
jgi:Flp pilus assembly protein TadD